MRVNEFAKNGNFGTIYLLDNSHVFIILFKASNQITNSILNFHRKIIKNTTFRNINPLFRTIIH